MDDSSNATSSTSEDCQQRQTDDQSYKVSKESVASRNLSTHQNLEPRRAIVIDGMALVNTIKKADSMRTCKDFAEVFVQTFVHDEIRLIFDCYVQGSLKQ